MPNALDSFSAKKKELWVDPAIEQLDLSDTAAQMHTGNDGETQYADCTRS